MSASTDTSTAKTITSDGGLPQIADENPAERVEPVWRALSSSRGFTSGEARGAFALGRASSRCATAQARNLLSVL